MELVWNPLVNSENISGVMEINFDATAATWNDAGLHSKFGPLRIFLEKYCSMSMIVLSPNEQAPVRLLLSLAPSLCCFTSVWGVGVRSG